jgi:hypothetical protein
LAIDDDSKNREKNGEDRAYGDDFLLTSAKTGANVEAAFRRVAARIVTRKDRLPT